MQRVENLTDGAIPIIGNPVGKIGDVCPTRGVDKFQNEISDSLPYWGLRHVSHKTFGVVFQALVKAVDGSSAWINLKFLGVG